MSPPDYIVERYKKKHGYYLAHTEKTETDKKRFEGTWLAMWFSCIFAVFTLALALLVRLLARGSEDTAIWFYFPALLFAYLFVLIRGYCFVPLVEERQNREMKLDLFTKRYDRFLSKMSLTPDEMHVLKDAEVSAICEKTLINLGAQAMAATREPAKRAKLTVELVDKHEAIIDVGYGKMSVETYIAQAEAPV